MLVKKYNARLNSETIQLNDSIRLLKLLVIWKRKRKQPKPKTASLSSVKDGGGFREGGGGRSQTRETDLFRKRPSRRGAEASVPDGESRLRGACSPPYGANGLRRDTRAGNRG